MPFTARHGCVLIGALVLAVCIGDAQAGPGTPSIPATILKWTPLLAQGFALNIAMSVLAMAIGTVLGLALGLGLISLTRPARAVSWLVTQFFRNAPWLVLLFYCVLLMPFEVRIGGVIVPLPGWAKATAGLALPVMANVAELVRGAVQSIPSGQWEASEALAFQPSADATAGHPAAMREADDAALDEPLRHRRGGDAAHLHRRRQRGDDAHRRRIVVRGPHRAFGADVSLFAHLVLHLLLPDRPRDGRGGTALCGAVMAEPAAWNPGLPLIRMRDVIKRFGQATILDGISLDVMKGQVICIIGPSGAGKSTLLRCINALVPIDSGSILVEGQEVNDVKLDKLALRRKVGMVFQQYNLFPHRSALANIMMAPVHVLKRKRAEVEAQARALMRKVRLDGKEDFYPGELSGGQQQRVAIARSLAMQPDVMLFDEVTAALDPETVKEVLVTIRDLAEEGMTCVIVTHEMGFAREVADEIYFTDRGVVVEHGPPAEFFANCRDERTRRFLSQIL